MESKNLSREPFLMLISFSLFYFFSSLAILASFFVIFTKNPVFATLFLIFTFTNVSSLLFLFNFEFLPISFLIIYVGAIAVLFLFVLMMLNIKLAELQESYITLLPVSLIFSIIFLVNLIFLLRSEFLFLYVPNADAVLFLSDLLSTASQRVNFNSLLGLNSNLKIIALAIYTDYLFAFLISSFVLLLAMVAAIILTIQKSFTSKSQNVYAQIMGDFNKTVVNYL
jgi:NADH-quinone oxidoreductase subunit J